MRKNGIYYVKYSFFFFIYLIYIICGLNRHLLTVSRREVSMPLKRSLFLYIKHDSNFTSIVKIATIFLVQCLVALTPCKLRWHLVIVDDMKSSPNCCLNISITYVYRIRSIPQVSASSVCLLDSRKIFMNRNRSLNPYIRGSWRSRMSHPVSRTCYS